MLSVGRCCKVPRRMKLSPWAARRQSSNKALPATEQVAVDEYGIPQHPTWSVHSLLTSYPKPRITPSTLKRMFELSALVPPEEGTPQHTQITQDMEGLVQLVEAVKLVETCKGNMDTIAHGIPDGRIWAEGAAISLDKADVPEEAEVHGRALLKHAERTENGLYVVPKNSRKEDTE